MDSTTLLADDISDGLTAVRAISAAGLPVAVAAWLKVRGTYRWELFIASPDVQKYGPTTVGRFVDTVLLTINSPIKLRFVVIANTTNHFVNEISPTYISSLPLSNDNRPANFKRLANITLGSIEIDDAFVYKVGRVRASAKAPSATTQALQKARQLAA